MPHILMPDELKAMHPTRRLRPYIPPTPAALAEEHGSVDAVTGDSLPSGTYHWGSLLRIDVLEAPADASLLFYGTGAIQVRLHARRVCARRPVCALGDLPAS